MKKSSYIAIAFLSTAALFSCKKTLDINKDPNTAADVTVKELLPSAETSIGQVTGNYFQVVGGIWSQYWTQNPNSSQYRSFEQYEPGPSTADVAWTELYAGGLTDLKKIVEKADTALNTKNYTAIAKILQAYSFQLLTDQFGDIPFSEALQGEDKKITSPKYDKQQDVYAGIVKLITDAQALIDPNAAGPGAEDLIYSGDMIEWYKFSNSLLLKVYLRMAYVNPSAAQAGISAMSPFAEDYLNLNDGDLSGQVNYVKDAGNTNPLFSEMANLNHTQNLIASKTGIDSFFNRNDVRIDAFYYANGTNYVGLQQGFYSTPTPGAYALPGAAVGGIANPPTSLASITAAAPVRLVSVYESLFLQAEAAARGWLPTGGDAKTLYEDAITANFLEFGFASTDAADYITNVAPYPTTGINGELKSIITEKWYAMCGNQNIESWTEWRRTGYPDFFTLSVNSRIGNVFPVRLPYPETEVNRNLNFPGQKLVTEKVWWDAN